MWVSRALEYGPRQSLSPLSLDLQATWAWPPRSRKLSPNNGECDGASIPWVPALWQSHSQPVAPWASRSLLRRFSWLGTSRPPTSPPCCDCKLCKCPSISDLHLSLHSSRESADSGLFLSSRCSSRWEAWPLSRRNFRPAVG